MSKGEPLKQQRRSWPEPWPEPWPNGFHAFPAKSRWVPGNQQRAQNLGTGWSRLGRWIALLQSRLSLPFILTVLPYSFLPMVLSKYPLFPLPWEKTTQALLLEL